MGCEFSASDNDCFVHVVVTGENTPDNVRGCLRKVYELCGRTGRTAVLIEENLTGPRLPPVDVYRIALEASRETAPVILRIAYIDARAQRDASNVELVVAVARDQGVTIKAFPTVAEAGAWLMSQAVL